MRITIVASHGGGPPEGDMLIDAVLFVFPARCLKSWRNVSPACVRLIQGYHHLSTKHRTPAANERVSTSSPLRRPCSRSNPAGFELPAVTVLHGHFPNG